MDSIDRRDGMLLSGIEKKFHVFNHRYFNGTLPVPRFRLSRRLRKAGKCKVVTDGTLGIAIYEAEMVFSVLYHDKYGWEGELEDTLKHEMAHLYLFINGRPWGHTREFEEICCRIGAATSIDAATSPRRRGTGGSVPAAGDLALITTKGGA